MDKEQLDRLFFALSDGTRRDVLSRLVEQDATISELAANYEMSLPAISKHIKILKEAGLVEITRSGRNKILRLEGSALELAQLWLATLADEAVLFDQLEEEIEALSIEHDKASG